MPQVAQRLANLSPAKRKLLEQRLQENTKKLAEPIAIVGMACRFAGARNLEEFWRLISEGIDATSEIPQTRWDVQALYDPTGEETGKMSVRWAGLVEGEDQFDPMFFGIAPREAAKMDPQQRLLLEVSWEALEHGGLSPERMSGSATGVFVGIGGTDYSKVPTRFEDYYHHIDAHVGTGNALSIASNRVSYILNLHGPSLSVDTACSSGLVAVHLAVQALRNRECDAALAGGVNMILSPETTIAFSKARMLSPDGKCRPFDSGANGYVRGEGCAMIVLKRLTDAVADGDRILAVLRSTAVNQDGKTSGITAPNGQSQIDCIRAALAGAGLTGDKVNYVEAHGTGTPLGDPIEVQALGEVFRDREGKKPPVYMSSVKGNIGHTETVSGMASIVKVLLMMQHGQIGPQANFKDLNPNMSLAGTRLRIPTELTPWRTQGGPRTAGVSSFGFGGTNTHVIIEEAAAPKPATHRADVKERPLHMLTITAKTETALRTLAGQFADDLSRRDDAALADFCFTANAGRSHFNHRLAIIAENGEQLRQRLAAVAAGGSPSDIKLAQVKIATRPKVAFLFTGQGSQYLNMARQLYETEPAFRQMLDKCNEILHGELEHSLLSVLYPELVTNGKPLPAGQSLVDQTAYTQPALFAIEYSLATLWRSWGVEPAVVLGHSVGEYVAACLAGVFNLEDGLRLIALRARLMQRLPAGGQMAVIFAPIEQVAAAVAPHAERLSVAAHNGPTNTVISGAAEAVQAVVSIFEHQGVRTQLLTVSHAFHSPLMDGMLDRFEREAAKIDFRRPLIPLVSNLTGKLLTEAPTARYWRDHIRGTVRFVESVQVLGNRDEFPLDAVLEVGPTPHLLPNARRILPQLEAAWLPSLRQGQEDWRVLLGTLADLYVLGVKVDWKNFDAGRPRRRLALPTYPFERSRHWFADAEKHGKRSFTGASRGPLLHPLLGSAVPSPLEQRLFEVRLSGSSPGYLKDHQVQGSPVTPAAAYVEQALAAADQAFGPGPHVIENLAIQQAMFLPEGSSRTVQLTASPAAGGECSFETYSIPADGDGKANWTMHACGRLRHAPAVSEADRDDIRGLTPPARRFDLDEVRSRVAAQDTREDFYEQMKSRGLAYGPAFQVLDEMCRTDRDALAAIRLPQSVAAELPKYHLHPALLDGCFQAMAGIVPLEADGSYSTYTYMPTGVRRVRLHAPLTERMFTYAVRTSDDSRPSPEFVEGDVYLLNENGEVLLELSGVRVTRVGRAAGGQKEESVRDWLYRIRWQPQPLAEAKEAAGQARAVQAGTWLIFADTSELAQSLASQLREKHGQESVLVLAGDHFAKRDTNEFSIDPLAGPDYERLLREAFATANAPRACAGVIHLWSLDIPQADEAKNSGDAMLSKARRLGCGSALQLIRELARSKAFDRPPSLWLVTRGAVGGVWEASPDADSIALGQSPLWGLGRVAAIEHPELKCRLVDLDAAESAAEAAAHLGGEVVLGPTADAAQDENQIAYRASQRCVARLAADPEAIPSDDAASQTGQKRPAQGPYQLRVGKNSGIDNLHFASFAPQKPEAGQVEIEVRAAGLNFSDVLKAMGLYPGIRDEIVPLGIECSGVVTAVGEGVTRFKVGDEVFGVAPYSFASHVRTADYALVHKPLNIDDAEACTIPITFLTAYYALRRLADLQRGERVLIHAGAGGVGLAAIQIAQQIGAEIFCTAGSDEKRNYLRSLGVPHVLSSRSLTFADEIMQITSRQGVDVVLNSLPGDAIVKSLGVLRAYGRFLEIGKIDIYANRMIGLSPFQDNLSYFAIDLDRMLRQRPDYIRGLFAEVLEHFASGDYRPLAMTKFPIDDVASALRYMAQRKNTGKVVVEMESRAGFQPASGAGLQPAASDLNALRQVENLSHTAASYLITGGLGALGLQVAEFLAEQGAGHLVLLGRRAPSGEAAEKIAAIEAKGAKVAAIAGDVADRASLDAALRQIPGNFPPLRGVVHAAGVLADGVMFDMDLARLDKAMTPKVAGAWNLHAATANQPLDFFVMFSSVACVLGSPGQANYAAGNAFLDALCSYRHSLGMPATSINWGPWGGSGMAAEGGRDAGLSDRGMNLLPSDKALQLLAALLRQEEKLPPTAVMSVRWDAMLKLNRGPVPPLLRDVAPAEGSAPAPAESAADKAFREKLLAAGIEDREQLLREFFSQQLAHIMGLEAASIDTQQPLNTLGLDSLMAIELKINIETRLKITLPMSQFMESPSVASLAKYVAKNIGDGAVSSVDAAAKSEEAAGASLRSATSHPDTSHPATQDWNPLLALQPDGERPPLICVHPAGGNVLCYDALSRHMGEGQPVYALQARGSDGIGAPHTSIDEMVNDYLAAVRSLQPRGPYYLAAWSSGGPVAYEMAYRLKQQGDEVGLLALIDSWPSLVNVDLDDDAMFLMDLANFFARFYGSRVQLNYDELKRLEPDAQLEHVLAEARKLGVISALLDADSVRRFLNLCKANLRIMMHNELKPCELPVHFFRAATGDLINQKIRHDDAGDYGWGELVGKSLVVHEVPGDHVTMLTGENAMNLAARLRECIDSAHVPASA
jgi:acyl transferase domain-containing protein/thioesterase domain-containing protein/acyl carrier protein